MNVKLHVAIAFAAPVNVLVISPDPMPFLAARLPVSRPNWKAYRTAAFRMLSVSL